MLNPAALTARGFYIGRDLFKLPQIRFQKYFSVTLKFMEKYTFDVEVCEIILLICLNRTTKLKVLKRFQPNCCWEICINVY